MSEAMKPGTPLPFRQGKDTSDAHKIYGQIGRIAEVICGEANRSKLTAAYIVHACNNYPATAREVEELRAEVERLREALGLADAALRGANMNMAVVERKIKAALASKGEAA